MQIGELVDDKYSIYKKLGKGGFGEVFKVEYEGNLYALKICSELDAESLSRFKREIKLMMSVQHENVIDIIDFNLDYSPPYFVMPLCINSLQNLIDEEFPKIEDTSKKSIKIILQICNGVKALHNLGIFHRDLKPSNILLASDRKIKVSDFGLGKSIFNDFTSLTNNFDAIGSHGYIPPEFFTIGGTKNPSIQSDIYQIGKILYVLLTNNNPNVLDFTKIDGGLHYILQRCLDNNPEKRFNSVHELERVLNSFLESLEIDLQLNVPIDELLKIINEDFQNSIVNKSKLEDLFNLMYNFKQDEYLVLITFHKINSKLLDAISHDYSLLFNSVCELYMLCVEKYFISIDNNKQYTFASTNGFYLKFIFEASKDLVIKLLSLRITLFVGVICNRYQVMDLFTDMLYSIQSDGDARAVIQMLSENKNDYLILADRIKISKLNLIIQDFHHKVLN